ncbi:hypothetical protein TWF506_001941 [Arthrobotrys conoides]|uniref:UV-endonuclease UVE-1 n=1 Tax=Arthrobotrys conoides TaxID=74498 RepID=A0AAN8NI26_9PEZI
MFWRYKGFITRDILSLSPSSRCKPLPSFQLQLGLRRQRLLPTVPRPISRVISYTTLHYTDMSRGRKPSNTGLPSLSNTIESFPSVQRRSKRTVSAKADYAVDLPSPPDSEIIDGKDALRASPTAIEDEALSSAFLNTIDEDEKVVKRRKAAGKKTAIGLEGETPKKSPARKRKAVEALSDDAFEPGDHVGSDEAPVNRPPPVNDEYRPIPFKGRLGFACLNTYLRSANPPIFCSRTCRLDTIHKHDTESGPGGGLTYVKSLGFQNATDLGHLIRWNHKYNIKFLRISSEMFPFASHSKYGYDIAHAAEPLKEAGRLAMEYGHRLTMHPGQYTQLASPRDEVVDNAIRDLEYHCELLDRLQLVGQADKDAVMIIHMGGTFGDKPATLNRFRKVYTTRLSEGIKRRLVLENDDVCWSVEDLIDICEELGIPMVLDWHHNNIVHGKLREGTLDVKEIYGERIKNTWVKKGIKQKQHYSEPREGSLTDRDRRRHSPRVWDLPPCEDDMDLMIEAKDKEQAVFEVMRKFKLDGWEKVNDVVPYERTDGMTEDGDIKVHELAMGGVEGRVYWPQGMEEYLKPKKKVRAKKAEVEDGAEEPTPKKRVKKAVKSEDIDEAPLKPSRKASSRKAASKVEIDVKQEEEHLTNGLETEATADGKAEISKPTRTKRAKKTIETVASKAKEVVETITKRRSGRTAR